MVENHKMVVENSGLLTIAALRHLDFTGKKVVSVLSGGNMDVITMSSVVQSGLIKRDRVFTVSVLLPDRPGQLVRVAQIIADLSRHFTLMPGDLIFTGTPQGVMQGYPADRKDWLKPGDRVSVTIQGIGTLENTFV